MSKTTDTERADVLRLLDRDKPLKDHDDIVLFYDKREVELVWTNKTAEVCNVVLPFQIIERVDERRT